MVFQVLAMAALWFLPELATFLPDYIYGSTGRR
jgi:hypothetical protein